jgi:hypothetical protein
LAEVTFSLAARIIMNRLIIKDRRLVNLQLENPNEQTD